MVGGLYLTGTIAGVLSVVFMGPLGNDPGMDQLSTNPTPIMMSAVCVLIMGLALALIPVVVYPIARKVNETLAVGYIVFRGALETVTYLFTVTIWLFLLPISTEFVRIGAAETGQALTALFLEAGVISTVTTFVFILGALMFYALLYQSRLVPRWLSGWGFASTVPYLLAGVLVMVGRIDPMSILDAGMRLPLGLQEMALALWLIVKGFEATAVAPRAHSADDSSLIEAYSH